MKSHDRIAKPSLADYLAVMSRAVFQAGLSWAAIDRQWDPLREAFDEFDVKEVARYRTRDIERIMTSPVILHSRRKIQATIKNAATILALDKEYKGFRKYLRSLGSYEELTVDLKRRFAFVGDISAYYFLYRVGEPVPPFNRWIKTVEGDHPRILEMVAKDKSEDQVTSHPPSDRTRRQALPPPTTFFIKGRTRFGPGPATHLAAGEFDRIDIDEQCGCTASEAYRCHFPFSRGNRCYLTGRTVSNLVLAVVRRPASWSLGFETGRGIEK